MSVNHRGIILFTIITLTFSPLCLADDGDRNTQPSFGQVLSETLETVWETVRGVFANPNPDGDPDLDDELFVQVRQLKAEVFGYLSEIAQQLPSLTKYTTAKTLPSLVIAYTLYEDAERDLEIVARNNIKRPTFIAAQTLEVLDG